MRGYRPRFLAIGRRRQNGGERPSRTRAPKAAGLQPASCVPQVTLPRELEPSRGIEPQSARYRRAALPLSYDGLADSLGHDPNTPAGTHCLAGRHGNLAVCAVRIWRSAEESNPLPIRYPSQFSGLVADHSAGTLPNWYPCSDSNREPSRSKRDTSTELGYRGELVRAVGFEPTLPKLSTSCLLSIGLRAHGAAPGIRTQTEHGLSVSLLPIEREPRIGRPEEC